MSKENDSPKQDEWLGKKPKSKTREVITIGVISAIFAVAVYGIIERVLNVQSSTGGFLIGIFSGLLTSGLTTGITWLAYDYFLPMQRHLQFRPKVDGKWFGYYKAENTDQRCVEFVKIDQVADKISGTMTGDENDVYEFVGQIVLGTLVLNWVSHDDENDMAGSMILRPIKSGLWSGLHIAGHSLADRHHGAGTIVSTPYLLSKAPITDNTWKEWQDSLGSLIINEGMQK
jgi:hypothetical protein